jgi:hypothetical protein
MVHVSTRFITQYRMCSQNDELFVSFLKHPLHTAFRATRITVAAQYSVLQIYTIERKIVKLQSINGRQIKMSSQRRGFLLVYSGE